MRVRPGPPGTAIALAILAWLLLAYLGGLLQAPVELHSWAAEVSRYLPTRLWGGGDLGGVQDQAASLGDWLGLAARAVGFAASAPLWGYRRDEGANYR